jgi:NAD(P)-dependent dehydrogenase (short-subunit alcohol dehydrogenase family)
MFSRDASYLLPGGLGGIGRSTSRWMVSRGARSLIFINRSATWTESTKAAVNELLIELKQKGCTATVFECDISNREMLAQVIEKCEATLPPIKGCIHGAMQLKVCVGSVLFQSFTNVVGFGVRKHDTRKLQCSYSAQGSRFLESS